MNIYSLHIIIAFISGMGLGILYYGSLWLTVRKLPYIKKPALLILFSFIGRMVVILLGFYFVMGGQWERLIICLLGFLLIRRLSIIYLQPDRIRA